MVKCEIVLRWRLKGVGGAVRNVRNVTDLHVAVSNQHESNLGTVVLSTAAPADNADTILVGGEGTLSPSSVATTTFSNLALFVCPAVFPAFSPRSGYFAPSTSRHGRAADCAVEGS
eukprot:m.175197 g.175197  ORF g.175197 m.175197 type:complete len:116 (-) comp17915_c1_seq1:53-400(-)